MKLVVIDEARHTKSFEFNGNIRGNWMKNVSAKYLSASESSRIENLEIWSGVGRYISKRFFLTFTFDIARSCDFASVTIKDASWL